MGQKPTDSTPLSRVAMRRLAPVVGLLTLLLPSLARAQNFSCTASSGVPPTVRTEGLAERAGDLVLTCTGGTPTPAGLPVPQQNIRVFLNVNVTSGLLDGDWSEALLMIDDPAPDAQRLCASSGCAIDGVGGATGVDYTVPGAGPPNVFQGFFVTPNQVEWLGVPLDPSGPSAVRIVRITNVRVNASQLPLPDPLPASVTTFVSATGTTSLPIDSPQQIVAFIQDGVTFSVDATALLAPTPSHNDPADPSRDLDLVFLEGFATAFLSRNAGTTPGAPDALLPQDQPNLIYNTESGFFNPMPVVDSDHFASAAGLASQGTRLSAAFDQVPSGVRLFVTREELGDPTVAGGPSAILAEGSDESGSGGSLAAHSSPDEDGLWAEVPLADGGGVAAWEIVAADPFAVEEVRFGVAVQFDSDPLARLPAEGTATVKGGYAPLSTDSNASGSAPLPRFVDATEVVDLVTIRRPGLEHFLLYRAKPSRRTAKPVKFGPVFLTDRFGEAAYDVSKPKALGLPADKNREGRFDEVSHLEEFQVKPRSRPGKLRDQRVINQCGDLLLEVVKPVSLLLPTAKSRFEPVDAPLDPALDHFLCYRVKRQARLADGTKLPKPPKGTQVRVTDQFDGPDRLYDLGKATKLCNPVAKGGAPVVSNGPDKGDPFPITPAGPSHPTDHLLCYQAKLAARAIEQDGCGPADPGARGTAIQPRQPRHEKLTGVHTNNQFGPMQLDTRKEVELCIPSKKLSISGELATCAPAVTDTWSFAVAVGQEVFVQVDTVDPATAADLCFSGNCAGVDFFAGEDEFPCSFAAPGFECPETAFVASTGGGCTLDVSVCSDACADPALATYGLTIQIDGVDAAPTSTANDVR